MTKLITSRFKNLPLEMLAQVSRRWKPPGMERLVRKLCDPDRSETPHLRRMARCEGTFQIPVDTTSYLEWKIFFFGSPDLPLDRWIRQNLPRGGVAFDVGANIGWHTLVMAKAVGPRGQVIAIEPHPALFEKLLNHVRFNGLAQVAAFPCALGSSTGKAVLHAPRDEASNQGLSTLCEGDQDLPVCVSVEVKTLDDLVEGLKITRLDFIKIDAEGWDLFVLQGAEQSLRRFRPAVAFEFAQSRWNLAKVSFLMAQEWLGRKGYRIFLLRNKRPALLKGNPPYANCNLLALASQTPEKVDGCR